MQLQSRVVHPLLRRQSADQQVGGCPNGGKWYACSEGSFGFVGCCTVNPCTSVGCAAGNVRAASLGDIPYGSTPDQACQLGGQFFTCLGPPPFWGCCKINPCASGVGCPQEQVAPAALAELPQNPFKAASTTSAGGSRQTGDNDGDEGSSTPTGAIVGGVVGGIAFLAIIGVLIWWLRRRGGEKKEAAPTLPMAQQPHSQHPDANTPLTAYPEVADPYAPKRPFPPSAYASPALPAYNERRTSYELGNNESSGLMSPPMGSPNPNYQHMGESQGMRPMSYELVGSPSVGGPGGTPGTQYTPSMMSAPVSELPGESIDARYSQVSSNMRYSTQSGGPVSPMMPPPQPAGGTGGEPTGLGVSMAEAPEGTSKGQ
ncbi:hypothetical protein Dda_1297 [Drechslerella dactyloides]|uniref:Uncharacterized protein n=1 Tax=Drechslerella dactyloides TaxID=74499 RepID=A0AAD6J3V4_DREDA|nr:hypothetical protein Dda_1297 [Drechslerella dactyloides]